jgi:hypothetical protein
VIKTTGVPRFILKAIGMVCLVGVFWMLLLLQKVKSQPKGPACEVLLQVVGFFKYEIQ